VVAIEQFSLPADQNGYLMSYIGVLSMAMQGAGVAVFTKYLNERTIMQCSCLGLATSYYLMTWIADVRSFCLLLPALVCCLCLVNSVLTAAVSKAGTEEEERTGTLLGLNMAVHSLIRVAAPTAGAAVMSRGGLVAVGYLGVACNFIALPLIKRTVLGKSKEE